MIKVITYGTYDLLHQGHINLLRKAKELGDYLIVGVTSDSFDRGRGKLNVRNNVLERVEAVKATGYADEVIIEDYIGQKIDDIQKYNVDIFAIGSDWEGKFDYLNEFTKVIYLPRTEGISSTMLRAESTIDVKVGIIGCGRVASRFPSEAIVVSGVKVIGAYDINFEASRSLSTGDDNITAYTNIGELYDSVDAVYIATPHLSHYRYVKQAIEAGKHVLIETPMVLNGVQARELFGMAERKGVILMEANKTAHCPAFNHLMVMIKSGIIGEVVDVEASLSKLWDDDMSLREFDPQQAGGSLYELGSYPLLPIIKLLGVDYQNLNLYSRMEDGIDIYTKGVFRYPKAVCSFKVGLGVKTEGNLVVSGTKGYVYVPSPWWKTDYFEIRYEDQNENKKFFYKWDGAGLRYEIQEFISCILNRRFSSTRLRRRESICMADIMQQFMERKNFIEI
ncbi:Gfo/Idh/MocA family oxidoreductase [Bacteroides stercorirosoris]|uniref:Glycerol-3-phosphate cytidylyltransferase n=1 Tax=Bacteroides stercorirosoris TaxID=871324 RepID=A0A1M6LZ54_9BACE|nr:Gfo/Idh/MocA family oxidoreductase [Bacteroides stercorirosoris]RGX79994.1 glycerol-3-phosphate cytidylyltransferase [Bacteroides stercorirosoris]SHJ76432.1 glycerol-3-phosphate cytidylyltransferase [Bacteroides stercorirosoris]